MFSTVATASLPDQLVPTTTYSTLCNSRHLDLSMSIQCSCSRSALNAADLLQVGAEGAGEVGSGSAEISM